MEYLNKQARDNLRYHISERLPAQYLKCTNGLDQVLRMAWDMIITNSVNPKLTQALSLISNIYRYQLELSADSNTIAQAMMIVTQKTGQLKTLNMLDEKIAGFQSLEEEDKTTNGVF